MNDNKLKIRIQIQQQPPQAIEQLYPDLAEPEITYEQTYDWRRIAIVAVGLLCVIVLISYLIFRSSEEPAATAALPAEHQISSPPNNPVAPEVGQPNSELGNDASITDLNQSPAKMPSAEGDTTAAPLMSVPAAKPKSGTSIHKPIIMPRKKPAASAKISSHRTSDRPEILRAQLSHAIKAREPVDIVESIQLQPGESKPIFFYLHLRDLQDQEVTIHWYHGDKLDSQLPLRIRSNNWRTNARKQLDHERLGAWRVEVVDDSGNLLAARHFDVTQY